MTETVHKTDVSRARWRAGRRALILLLLTTVAVAFVLPIVPFWRGRPRPYEHQVIIEIAQLSQALTAFAAEFGRYPPSRITLHETTQNSDPQSRATIRQLWPKFDFQQSVDLNGDGDTQDTHVLSALNVWCFFWVDLGTGIVTIRVFPPTQPLRFRPQLPGLAPDLSMTLTRTA
ncbi:MAG: hypothetical protein R3C49_11140 [Planctomycetaceae bacterium]